MRGKIPNSVMEREGKLKQGLAEEITRKNVNDSKFRAVAQRMDYSGFHQMVLGANLKPTKAGEVFSISSQKNCIFNSSYHSPSTNSSSQLAKPILSVWRESSQSQRQELLSSPSDLFTTLQKFPDFTILAEIITVIPNIEDSSLIDSVLSDLTKVLEFRGSRKLLSKREKECLDKVLGEVNKQEYLEFFG